MGFAQSRQECAMLLSPVAQKNVMQLCWVVPDIHASMSDWTRTSGVGPFFFFDDVKFESGVYRGRPAQIAPHCAAIAQAGDLQIELVSQDSDEPSIWRELVPRDRVGLHHIAYYCDDYEGTKQAYIARGVEVAFEGLMVGSYTCYLDTVATLGFMTELVTKNPIADQVFATFRQASADWDGADPIRRMG
jgi:hypothetical protein